MAVSKKIFDALISTLKMHETMLQLAEDVKQLAYETRDLERRLIRLETYIEIAEKGFVNKNKKNQLINMD